MELAAFWLYVTFVLVLSFHNSVLEVELYTWHQ